MAAAESLIIQTTALCSFLLLVAWFSLWHLTGLVQTERQRAYVLTLLSSAIMTLSSVPLVWEILTTPNGFQQLLPTTDGNDYWWTIAATTFFMTFLVTDLAVGSIFYRSKIQVLTGWIHHIAYVGLLIWVIRNHYTPVFVAMCLLEAPTLMLALGSVFKSLRRDYVFAALFVPTRIVFHGYMIADVSFRKPFYWGICIALCITFALHCYWFYGKSVIAIYEFSIVTRSMFPCILQVSSCSKNDYQPKSKLSLLLQQIRSNKWTIIAMYLHSKRRRILHLPAAITTRIDHQDVDTPRFHHKFQKMRKSSWWWKPSKNGRSILCIDYWHLMYMIIDAAKNFCCKRDVVRADAKVFSWYDLKMAISNIWDLRKLTLCKFGLVGYLVIHLFSYINWYIVV